MTEIEDKTERSEFRCGQNEPVTGDLSSFVSFSSLTSRLKIEEVSWHARSTADTATSFSSAKARDIAGVVYG